VAQHNLPAARYVVCHSPCPLHACQLAGTQSRGVPRIERKEGATCGDLQRSATCVVSTITHCWLTRKLNEVWCYFDDYDPAVRSVYCVYLLHFQRMAKMRDVGGVLHLATPRCS
jgi:hypothetical protein